MIVEEGMQQHNNIKSQSMKNTPLLDFNTILELEKEANKYKLKINSDFSNLQQRSEYPITLIFSDCVIIGSLVSLVEFYYCLFISHRLKRIVEIPVSNSTEERLKDNIKQMIVAFLNTTRPEVMTLEQVLIFDFHFIHILFFF
jgi:hypothetical protein